MTDAIETTILLVEDDELVSGVIERTLRYAGYTVECVRLGDEALRHLRESPTRWSAVVLDLSLPDMPGREVLERIRESLARLPVLVTSGHDARTIPAETLRMASGFLAKPFRGEELLSALRLAMGA